MNLSSTIRKYAALTRLCSKGVINGVRLELAEALLSRPGIDLSKLDSVMPMHHKHLIVACMPKSGSTFLASALTHATGYSNVVLAFGFEQNEQDLYLPALIRNSGFDTVTQQHMRATDPNLRLLAAFHMAPIVLVRNLEDITISLYDHLHNTAIKASMGYLNESFFELDRVTSSLDDTINII